MKDVIQKHLLKANAEYHPIDLPKLDVPTFTFIGHLLALTNKNSDGDSVKQEEGPDGKKEKEKQAFLAFAPRLRMTEQAHALWD